VSGSGAESQPGIADCRGSADRAGDEGFQGGAALEASVESAAVESGLATVESGPLAATSALAT
jgi:hypothetical protein